MLEGQPFKAAAAALLLCRLVVRRREPVSSLGAAASSDAFPPPAAAASRSIEAAAARFREAETAGGEGALFRAAFVSAAASSSTKTLEPVADVPAPDLTEGLYLFSRRLRVLAPPPRQCDARRSGAGMEETSQGPIGLPPE